MMISSVANVKFIKTKVICRYHTKGVSNHVSSNSDHEIKSYSCSNSSTKIGKIKKKVGKNFLGDKTGQEGDYKSGQEGLQIGATLGISNRGKKITNQGRDFKSGQRDFKSGQRLQIGAKGISNRGRNYKSGQVLQIFGLMKMHNMSKT